MSITKVSLGRGGGSPGLYFVSTEVCKSIFIMLENTFSVLYKRQVPHIQTCIRVPSITPNEAKSIPMSVDRALIILAVAIRVPPIMMAVLLLRKYKPIVITNRAEI